MITKFEYYKALELADRIKSWREDDKAGYSGEILREAEDMLRRLADRSYDSQTDIRDAEEEREGMVWWEVDYD